MGLDTVELVMEVEDSFGISIDDADAPGISTVGQLFDYVLERIADRPSTCLTSFAFYRVRRALLNQGACRKQDVRPGADAAAFFPKETRRGRWRETERATGLRWPNLRRPPWLTTLITALAIDAGVESFCFFLGRIPIISAGAAALGISIAALICAWRLTEPWAVELAPEFATVGGLSRQLVAKNYAKLTADQWQGTVHETWDSLVTIISEQLGVERERITVEASFVNDLGAG